MTRILFDITRLIVRGARFSPTGIDRVVVAYARWLLSRPDVDLQPVVTLGGHLFGVRRSMLQHTIRQNEAFSREKGREPHGSSPWGILNGALESERDLLEPLRAKPIIWQVPARAKWYLAILGRSLWGIAPVRPTAGAIYLNVSHTGLDQRTVLAGIRAHGVRPVVMVHDLIPIRYPEYCAPSAEARHIRRMDEIVAHAELVIANSTTTASELSDYARSLGRAAPAITTVPLGVEVDFRNLPRRQIGKRPYFVCVGTLEARKNVAFLLAIWRELASHMQAEAPRLVLVGRRGWENEAVIDHLQRSKAVIRLVHEVADLRDRELAQVVSGAAALLAPSLAEGYDLPVVEALALGTPVIASDIAAHREVAPTAELIAPLDGPAWLSAIQRAAVVREDGPNYDPPTWEAHFEKVSDVLQLS